MTRTISWFPHALAIACLLAAVSLIYAQTLDDEWHFDDSLEIERPGVRQFSPSLDLKSYRGFVVLWTWALNYQLSGEEGWSYHLTNFGIHWLNGVLVYWMVWLLAGLQTADGSGLRSRRWFLSWTGALIFCVHPVATQAVSYVTQRSTALATTFVLLAVCCYVASRAGGRRLGHRLLLYGSALLAFGIGLHTKHVALTTPALLVFFEWLFARGVPSKAWRRIASLLPFFFLLSLRLRDFFSYTRLLHPAIPDSPTLATPTGPVDWRLAAGAVVHPADAYLWTQLRVIIRYIRLFILPTGQNLDYDYPVFGSLSDGPVIASLVLILAILVVAVVFWKRRPLLTFGVLFLFITLAPTSSVIPSPDVIFEHRAYPALAGFALAVAALLDALRGWAARRGVPRAPVGAWALAACLVLALGTGAFLRNRVWDTEITLWTDTAAKSPQKARPHQNLGMALQTAGRLEEAQAEYERVLALAPNHALAHNNLGNIYREKGRLADAAREFRRAIELDPLHIKAKEAHSNLGNVLVELGRFGEAEEAYRTALEVDPGNLRVRYNIAQMCERQGRMDRALEVYEELVRSAPGDAVFLNALGSAYFDAGRLAEAEKTLREAEVLHPDSDLVHYNLGLVNEALQKDEDAIRQYEKAVAINPRFKEAYHNLAIVLMRVGEARRAIVACRTAVVLDPSFEPARRDLEVWESLQTPAERAHKR